MIIPQVSILLNLLQPPYDISSPTLARIRNNTYEYIIYLESKRKTGISPDDPVIEDLGELYDQLIEFINYLVDINFASNYIETLDEYTDRLHALHSEFIDFADPEIQKSLRLLRLLTT